MGFVEAIILGLVQGLTEFLPISSSAHLRIVGEFLPSAVDPGATFTAITQIGTELAVLIYFAKRIGRVIAAWFASLRPGRTDTARMTPDARLGWIVIIGTIPSARRFPSNPSLVPGPAVARFNQVVRALVQHYGLVLADYNAVMSNPDGSIRDEHYIEDGVHPAPAGYAAMQPVFDAALGQARATLPAQVSGSK